MNLNQEIANAVFPSVTRNLTDLERIYPARSLPVNAMVTRFAPSPTGFLHTGSLFASLCSWRYAKQSGGVFFCRLEDTDTKREISGSGNQVLVELAKYGIIPDEDFVSGGAYGPYVQSERKFIYDVVIKDMLENDLAYPCFCTHEDLDAMRRKQEILKVNPGYYGEYAVCRLIPKEQVLAKIKNGDSFVIRFKSPGNQTHKILITDLIRGSFEMTENDQDIVIMKGDGLPTYHFAHLVDDHFMRSTVVTRGEEWMASLPIHLQLFDAMGWDRPKYAHLPDIMKLDEGTRRKLSKRKDPEAAVSFFLKAGYPFEGFLEYLMTIANTNFEAWRLQNPEANIFDFRLSFDKMTLDGALFDLEKVKSISKDRLALFSTGTITEKALEWAKLYQPDFASVIESDISYFHAIMAIERGGEKPRKDYAKYSDIFPIIDFMYDQYYDQYMKGELPFNPNLAKTVIINVLNTYNAEPSLDLGESEWFEKLKSMATECGFSPSVKEYKKNKEAFYGHIGDFAEIIRISVSGKKNTPNFYYILKILGIEKISKRINKTIALLKE
ncbi:MAG: glutamate--tRNA ligase family protein [Candidatus Izemoplasmatales bacterium]